MLLQDCSDDAWKSSDAGCTPTYCSRQTHAQTEASTVMSIPYIISACLSPFLGAFVDRFGYRAVIATVAPAALIIVHSMLGFTEVSPVGPLVGQGLSYAMFAAVIWPSIPLVIEPQYIGLGYGVTTSVQNAGLAIFPVIIASIYTDNDSHYIPSAEEFFVGLACLGFIVGLYLNYYDYHNGNLFNSASRHTVPGNEDLDMPSPMDNKEILIAHADASKRSNSRDQRMSGEGRRLSSEIFATSMMH
jgi:MFS family permease